MNNLRKLTPREDFPADVRKKSLDQESSINIRRQLWDSAKRNFYYANDDARAAALCNRLIERFPLSEEADEARLLLHDIGTGFRKSARVNNAGSCLYCPQDSFGEVGKCCTCRDFMNTRAKESGLTEAADVDPEWDQTTRISIAIAVIALPIIGVAKGGIMGIGLPEIIGVLLLKAIFRGASKIRETSLGGQDKTYHHHPQNQEA